MEQTRKVEVAPERLERWCVRFGERHGGVMSTYAGPLAWDVTATDGAHAEIRPAFPPVAVLPGERAGLAVDELVAHANRQRRVGVLLVRLGAHAAGVFAGSTLGASKVERALVHGRSSAGGWSQQRFARRRDAQVRSSLEGAADVAARILLPEVSRLDAIVLGGDRRAVDRLRDDRRLAPLFDRAVDHFLTVPEPRLAILQDAPRLFRAARVAVSTS